MCERAIKTLESLKAARTFELSILLIDDDPLLFEQYWIRVPVVRVDGADVFEAKDIASEGDCKEKLEKLVSP